MEFLTTVNPTVISAEHRVYSRKYQFAGTVDKVAQVGADTAILDWKTGNGIYPEARMQTAAYAVAWEEENGLEISTRIIVRLGKKDGKFHVLKLASHKKDFAAFLSAKGLWEWKESQKNGRRKG